ncbi:MAG: hypothetical protein U0228_35100 [Myxococcaceae bacterium]
MSRPLLLALALVGLPGCWPFLFSDPPPADDDGGFVLDADGGTDDAGTIDGGWPLDRINCTWKGKKLYGKVQYVDSFPDVKIREVTALPDLKVLKVSALPSRCGEWEEVTSFPVLRVKVVTSLEDLQVEYVTSFPGIQ